VVVINKNKPEHLKNKILFINADREYGEGRNQNYLRPEDIEKIVTVFIEKKGVSLFHRPEREDVNRICYTNFMIASFSISTVTGFSG